VPEGLWWGQSRGLNKVNKVERLTHELDLALRLQAALDALEQ
jgi:hypothetical protein